MIIVPITLKPKTMPKESKPWREEEAKKGELYSFPKVIIAKSKRVKGKREELPQNRAFLNGSLHKIQKENYEFVGTMVNSQERFYFLLPKINKTQKEFAELYSEAT